MDLNTLFVLGLIAGSGPSAPATPVLIDRYDIETMDGIKFTVQADQCGLFYNGTTLGCYKDRQWVLVGPWDKIKHFKQEER